MIGYNNYQDIAMNTPGYCEFTATDKRTIECEIDDVHFDGCSVFCTAIIKCEYDESLQQYYPLKIVSMKDLDIYRDGESAVLSEEIMQT
mgnify:CR=1 FL=1